MLPALLQDMASQPAHPARPLAATSARAFAAALARYEPAVRGVEAVAQDGHGAAREGTVDDEPSVVAAGADDDETPQASVAEDNPGGEAIDDQDAVVADSFQQVPASGAAPNAAPNAEQGAGQVETDLPRAPVPRLDDNDLATVMTPAAPSRAENMPVSPVVGDSQVTPDTARREGSVDPPRQAPASDSSGAIALALPDIARPVAAGLVHVDTFVPQAQAQGRASSAIMRASPVAAHAMRSTQDRGLAILETPEKSTQPVVWSEASPAKVAPRSDTLVQTPKGGSEKASADRPGTTPPRSADSAFALRASLWRDIGESVPRPADPASRHDEPLTGSAGPVSHTSPGQRAIPDALQGPATRADIPLPTERTGWIASDSQVRETPTPAPVAARADGAVGMAPRPATTQTGPFLSPQPAGPMPEAPQPRPDGAPVPLAVTHLDAKPPTAEGLEAVGPVSDLAPPISRHEQLGTQRAMQAPAPTAQAPDLAVARSASEQIVARISTEPSGSFEIALQPEELGRVTLHLQKSEHGSIMTVQAERPETLDLLRRNIAQLEQDLRGMGHESLSFRFAGGGQQGAAQHPQQGGVLASDAPVAPTLTAQPAQHPAPATTDRLDLRL
ncbi:MAG: hypothetical protein Kow0013_03940 [Pararhodobacter sp.]